MTVSIGIPSISLTRGTPSIIVPLRGHFDRAGDTLERVKGEIGGVHVRVLLFGW
jgi:hypothetical protein